jgi:hypothetical protein
VRRIGRKDDGRRRRTQQCGVGRELFKEEKQK